MSLTLRDLNIRLGGRDIVSGLNLELQGPGVTGVVGANGAGKSTVLDALSGFVPVRGGSICWNGVTTTRRGRLGLAARLHQADIAPDIKAQDLVAAAKAPKLFSRMWCRPSNAAGAFSGGNDTIRIFAEYAGLPSSIAERELRELSGGQRRVINTLAVIATNKPWILLDEPFAGLAGHVADLIGQAIRRIASERLIIIVEHDLDRVLRIANRLVVMRGGAVAQMYDGVIDRKALLHHFI